MASNSIPASRAAFSRRRWLSRALTVLATAYGAMMMVIFLLRLLVGERWMVVTLLISGLHLLLMPSLVVLPACLLTRRWRLALLVAPPFLLFVTSYAVFFLPRAVTAAPDAKTITLLTYNLHAEERLLEPMVEVIRGADADIVALQEMSGAAAKRFEAELAAAYPYRALHPVSSPYHGRGILSRYPIVDDYAWPEEYPIPVRLERAELDIDGVPLTLYNMHAPPSYPIFGESYDIRPRAQQIADMLALAAEDSSAVILMGDFNITDQDENYQRITAHFSDTYREVGWGLGFTNPDWSHDNSREGPAFIPLYTRIDYIFHNSDLQALEARVWPTSGGSDHRPVFARLALVGAS